MLITPFTKPLLPSPSIYQGQLSDIWRKKQLTNNGIKVLLLEKSIAQYTAQKNILLTSSGTMALIIAIKALGLTGEIITTPFAFPAVPHAISFCGLIPIFCDVSLSSGNIDPQAIERMITKKTSAILAVHTFGIPCEIEKILAIAKKYSLKVIFDAAPAFNVKFKDKNIVHYGDASIHSYHATKIFHTVEGGAVFFRSAKHKRIAEKIREFGFDANKETIKVIGINGKMSEFHAAMGLCILPHINAEIKKRQRAWRLYTEELQNTPGVICPAITQNAQTYTIRIQYKKRNLVYTTLNKKNIITKKYYAQLASDFPHYINKAQPQLSNAKILSQETLALPLWGDLSKEQIQSICNLIKACLQ